jgi:NADH-quinone oxidoreductase subunit M
MNTATTSMLLANFMVPLLTLIPLAAVGIILVLPRGRETEIRWVALASTTLALALAVYLAFAYRPLDAGYQFQTKLAWVTQLGISYHVGLDGISCLVVLLHAVCSWSAVLVSFRIRERVKEYFVFFLSLIASIFGVFTALDLFFFYLFYEMAVIPIYPLISIWGSTQKEYGAMKLTLYITLGAVLALVGLLALYQVTGLHTFDLVEIKAHLASNPAPRSFELWCVPLFVIGFGVIASLWPFHSWSPIGYAAAPTAVSMLHAGVLKKIGIFAIIRLVIDLFPAGAAFWLPVVAALAVVNVLYGAWAAMAQDDLKFVIGFASVSHMGYALLGVAALNATALTGTVFFLFAHGLMAALCFAIVGFLYDQAHTRRVSDFGGLAKSLPFVTTCFVMAALASSGLPGFMNFVAELLIFFGAWQSHRLETVLAVFGIVVTATYMLRLVRNVFFGPLNPKCSALRDAVTFRERLPMGVLAALLLFFGFWPSLILDLIRPSVESIFSKASLAHEVVTARPRRRGVSIESRVPGSAVVN